MLASIRSFSKSIFAKVIFSLIALSFVGWGLNATMLNFGFDSDVAEVGDRKITPQELDQAFQRQVRTLQRNFGPQFDMQQALQVGVLDQTLQRMVVQALFEQGADDLGIGIGDDLVRQAIFANPVFQNEQGSFDRVRYEQILFSNGYTDAGYVDELRREMARDQVLGSLTAGLRTPESLAREIAKFRGEARRGRVLIIDNATVTGIDEPDEATLRAYHEENKIRFSAPEYRAVTLALLSVGALADGVDIDEETLKATYEERKASLISPTRRQFEHLLFAPEDATAAREAAAKLRAGADFYALAEEIGMARDQVDLGTFTQAEMLPEFARAAFSTPVDSITEPIETPLGWHILRPVRETPGEALPFEAVRAILEIELKRAEAEEAIFDLSARFEDALGGGATLEEAAREAGAVLRKIEAIDRFGNGLDGTPIEIPDNRDFLAMVTTQPVGEDSDLVQYSDGYFMFRVDGVTPAALRPFDGMVEEVRNAWMAERRREAARSQAEALLERLNAGRDLADLAGDLPLMETGAVVRDGSGLAEGIAPAVVPALFDLQPGTGRLLATGDGQLVVVLDKVIAAKVDPETVTALSSTLQDQMLEDIVAQYGAALRAEFGIDINSSVIASMYGSDSSQP